VAKLFGEVVAGNAEAHVIALVEGRNGAPGGLDAGPLVARKLVNASESERFLVEGARIIAQLVAIAIKSLR
jgi:hypothetical protein